MEKVYVVIEEYEDSNYCNYETCVNIFSTLEKAKEYLKKVVEREKQESWIADYYDEIDEDDLSFNAYYENNYVTNIYIKEKEIQ